MLPSKKRLKRKDFLDFPRNTPQVYNELGTLKYTPSSSFGASVITSSKHEKLAVKRNLLRRRIYAILGESPVSSKNINLVVYTTKKSYTYSYNELKTILSTLLERV